MPQYFSPGVYVEEVDSGPRPIQGVSTSVAGAVGVTVRGPTSGKPELVTSFNEFTNKFGGFLNKPDPSIIGNGGWDDPNGEGGYWWLFPHAVKGFFDNGGQQLYVKKVFSGKAVAASAELGKGMHSSVKRSTKALTDTVQLAHLFGVSIGTKVAIFNGQTNTKIEDEEGAIQFTVKAYDASTGNVQFEKRIAKALDSDGGDYVEIHKSRPDKSLEFKAKASGEWGNDLQVRVDPVAGATLNLLFDETDPAVVTSIQSVIEPVTTADYDGTITSGPETQLSVDPKLGSVIEAVIGAADNFELVGKSPDSATIRSRQVAYSAIAAGVITITPLNSRDEIQQIEIAGPLTGGKAVLSIPKADGTLVNVTIEFDAALAQIQAKIDAKLDAVNHVKAGGSLTSLTLTFDGTNYKRNEHVPVTIDISSLTGATKASVSVTKGDDGKFLAGSRIRPVGEPFLRTMVVKDAGLKDGEKVTILGSNFTIEHVGLPTAKTLRVTDGNPVGENWQQDTTVRKLRKASKKAPAPKSDTVRVVGADRLYLDAVVELDNGTNKELFLVQSIVGNVVKLSGPTTNQYYEGQPIRVIEASVSVRLMAGTTVQTVEQFAPLRLTTTDHPNTLTNAINRQSAFVEALNPAGKVTKFEDFPIIREGNIRWQPLVGGDDALGSLDVDDFIGVDGGSGKRTGIQALEDIDDISTVTVPGIWSPLVRAALIQHCEVMKYRFAILDPPPGLSIQDIRTFRSPIDTLFGALYYPWIRLRDPATSQNVEAPPSAHLAGLYARVDTERGVHKAPANEILRGILPANPTTGIGGLLQDVTKREQDLLNPEGINALRYFPGRGQRVWGARTVSSNSNFKYINVRRIFNFIEKSIDKGTQFVVFEPNDSQLWSRVRQTINNFLNTQWRAGILEGKVAEEAYFVACDRGVTMTQDDIENGRLICEVGIAPVFPAEFVIFRIQKFTADSKLA